MNCYHGGMNELLSWRYEIFSIMEVRMHQNLKLNLNVYQLHHKYRVFQYSS